LLRLAKVRKCRRISGSRSGRSRTGGWWLNTVKYRPAHAATGGQNGECNRSDEEGNRQEGRGAGQGIANATGRENAAATVPTAANAQCPTFRPLQENDANERQGDNEVYNKENGLHGESG
jgi:hypothetical protein